MDFFLDCSSFSVWRASHPMLHPFPTTSPSRSERLSLLRWHFTPQMGFRSPMISLRNSWVLGPPPTSPRIRHQYQNNLDFGPFGSGTKDCQQGSRSRADVVLARAFRTVSELELVPALDPVVPILNRL